MSREHSRSTVDVPLLRPPAIDVVRIRRPRLHVARQRDAAGAQRPAAEWRDAGRQRERVVVVDNRVLAVADRQRVEPAQRPRPRQRVVGDAVAGAQNRLLVQPVGRPEARRQQVLADLDPEIVGHVADAAEQHVERRRGRAARCRDRCASSAGSTRSAAPPSASASRLTVPAIADVATHTDSRARSSLRTGCSCRSPRSAPTGTPHTGSTRWPR